MFLRSLTIEGIKHALRPKKVVIGAYNVALNESHEEQDQRILKSETPETTETTDENEGFKSISLDDD